MRGRSIVVVWPTIPDGLWQYADEVLVSQPIEPTRYGEKARRDAIKLAMISAVEKAEPGDVVMQGDVVFRSDPFGSPLEAGKITILNPAWRLDAEHYCPQAFRFPDAATAEAIIAAWTTLRRQACTAWSHLPKIHYECAIHPPPVIQQANQLDTRKGHR